MVTTEKTACGFNANGLSTGGRFVLVHIAAALRAVPMLANQLECHHAQRHNSHILCARTVAIGAQCRAWCAHTIQHRRSVFYPEGTKHQDPSATITPTF